MAWRDNLQEIRELGLTRTLHRGLWELKLRSGAARWTQPAATAPTAGALNPDSLPWAAPDAIKALLSGRISPQDTEALIATATRAAAGKIRCFGRWEADYGNPIDWHLNPRTSQRWNARAHWSEALRDGERVGDVKLTWEVGRFPQAFHMARAATLSPAHAPALCEAFITQVNGFLDANPFPLGIHWNSNQECTLRLHAWLFALSVFSRLQPSPSLQALSTRITAYGLQVGAHTEREIDYARRAVYNNHLITESFGLFTAAWLNPEAPDSLRWRAMGLALLTEQSDAQVYPDGAYINLAHNYHRVIIQEYLLAWRFLGTSMPESWRAAMARSLDFLLAHQNPIDGRLPNYGANDGSLPRVLSTCDFSDFRPTLQALSLAVHGERLYPEGPWDEESLWTLGPGIQDAPLRRPDRRSVSFARTGFHVLRASDRTTFGALRCGTVRDRFGQIDMLHLDVFFRGHNVLVDGGTYLYNDEPKWHDHLLGTASHNTVTIDGRDQMLHHRRFKYLYWTDADLLRFECASNHCLAVGEHRGYARHPGRCVHRRAVLQRGERWVVVDRMEGEGRHDARLQWLGGDFEHHSAEDGARMTLKTPEGDFEVAVFGDDLATDVARGVEDPPRGWLSRYYGERVAVPSLVARTSFDNSVTIVSVLGPAPLGVSRQGDRWSVAELGSFTLRDGIPVMDS